MADIYRAPVFSTHNRPPDRMVVDAGSSLLVTTLAAAALFQIVNDTTTQVQRPAQVFAQSQGTNPELLPAPLEINAGRQFLSVQLPRLLSETSAGTPLTITSTVVAPITFGSTTNGYEVRNQPVTAQQQSTNPNLLPAPLDIPFKPFPDYYQTSKLPVTDQSRGTNSLLLAAFPPPPTPTFDLQQFVRTVVNTSQSTPTPILTTVVVPPFYQTDWPSPIEAKFRFEPGPGSAQPADLIPPAPPPPVVNQWVISAGYTHEREKIGPQTFIEEEDVMMLLACLLTSGALG